MTDGGGFELLVQQAEREFMVTTERRQPSTPFYHYTNAAGLEGILKSEAIWATHYEKLMDLDEMKRGELAIGDEVAALIQQYPDKDSVRGTLCREVEHVRKDQRLIDMPDLGIYVACFCSVANAQGQWTDYAAKATGYAIGFNSIPLAPDIHSLTEDVLDNRGIDFGPCVYNVDEFRARARGLLFFIADGLDKYLHAYALPPASERRKLTREQGVVVVASRTQRLCDAALHSALGKLGGLVPFLKDPFFAGEKEWRYIYMGPPEQASMRPTDYGPAGYNVISLKKGPRMDLHEVIVGSRAGAQGLEVARSTLDRCGYSHVPVRLSDAPLRPFVR